MSTNVIAIVISSLLLLTTLTFGLRKMRHWFIYKGNDKRDIPFTPLRLVASLYSLLVFIIMVYGIALPFAIVLYLTVWSPKRRLAIFHKFLQKSAKLILKLLPLIDFTYDNTVGEKFQTPGVIISNHQGHLDLMCIMMMTPNLVVITNDRVWHNVLYGWILRVAKFYPISNGLEYNTSKLSKLVKQGYSVVIFPEGTRSPKCEILRFHTGAFYLAAQLNVDIIPVILHGVGHCIPKSDFMLRPGHMSLKVMNRIKVEPDNTSLYFRKIARETRKLYIKQLELIRIERESIDYYYKYVINKYCFISGIRPKKVAHLLKKYNDELHDISKIGDNIYIYDKTYGASSWLMALTNPQLNVIGIIYSPIELKIAMSTPCKPNNLKFTDKQPTEKSTLIHQT